MPCFRILVITSWSRLNHELNYRIKVCGLIIVKPPNDLSCLQKIEYLTRGPSRNATNGNAQRPGQPIPY